MRAGTQAEFRDPSTPRSDSRGRGVGENMISWDRFGLIGSQGNIQCLLGEIHRPPTHYLNSPKN